LARDVEFLRGLAQRNGIPSDVFTGVASGNAAHRLWARRRLTETLGRGDGVGVAGSTVAVWGLTYKPGTDTLRRSSALELCEWLAGAGATVRAHDPAVKALPEGTPSAVRLCADPREAAAGADALVLCTAWPDYRSVSAAELVSIMRRPVVVDAAGFLAEAMSGSPQVAYVRVGAPLREAGAAGSA
jgi:UDPglucose 6-dehydrogenase